MAQDAFLERSRYYLCVEYPAKIRLATAHLSDAQVWQRGNDESNSIGNLLLHLAGNVRQWIVTGIGGAPDARDRQAEFAARDGPGRDELVSRLSAVLSEADAVLAALEPSELERSCTIQGRDTSVFGAIYHVVEHFSMHTGQIILLAKLQAPGAIRFYDDSDGRAEPLWGGREGMRDRRR